MLFLGQSIDLFLRWDIYINISAEQSQEPETGMKIKTAQFFFTYQLILIESTGMWSTSFISKDSNQRNAKSARVSAKNSPNTF